MTTTSTLSAFSLAAQLALQHITALADAKYIVSRESDRDDSLATLTALYASGVLDDYKSQRGSVTYAVLQALAWDLSAKRDDRDAMIDIFNTPLT